LGKTETGELRDEVYEQGSHDLTWLSPEKQDYRKLTHAILEQKASFREQLTR